MSAVTANTPGAVIDGLEINGTLTVAANDVTLRNVLFRSIAEEGGER